MNSRSTPPARLVGDRSGFALVMVLLVCFILGIASLTLWRVNTTDRGQIRLSIPRIQAQYLAKGALQLALLKARLCYTELYEAAFFSVGKNPFYMHKGGYAHLDKVQRGLDYETDVATPFDGKRRFFPGPAFITGDVDLTGGVITSRTNVKSADCAGTVDTVPDMDGDGTAENLVDEYLVQFRLDLCDRLTAAEKAGQWIGQPGITISTSELCHALGSPDPYEGRFWVSDMTVLGGKAGEQFKQEALKVVVRAQVSSAVAGKNAQWTAEETTIYRVDRDY